MAISYAMSNPNVDPRLLAWIQAAGAQTPYDIRLVSGLREGDPRFHGKGAALDVQLIDRATGKVIPNYQNAESFQAYQSFANLVRAAQMAANPDAENLLRWGGYFSGGKGKYGALDLMHFDVGGDTVGMGGGGWATGLTPEQAALWGLSPGGGYTGAPGPASPTAPVSPLLAGATLPPETPLDRAARAFGKLDLSKKNTSPQVTQTADRGVASMDFPVSPAAASPEQQAYAQAATNFARQSGRGEVLGDVFKLRDIGVAVPQGGIPNRRGW